MPRSPVSPQDSAFYELQHSLATAAVIFVTPSGSRLSFIYLIHITSSVSLGTIIAMPLFTQSLTTTQSCLPLSVIVKTTTKW